MGYFKTQSTMRILLQFTMYLAFVMHLVVAKRKDVPDEGCGNTSFAGPDGFITSPRFPLPYPNNLNCVYSLDVDRTKMVALRFLSFNIEGNLDYSDTDDWDPSHSEDCIHDWLMIRCLSNGSDAEQLHQSKKYCGEETMPILLGYSNCDTLTLNFVSDSHNTESGFQLQYTIAWAAGTDEDCGNTSFSGLNGVVTSPRYPFPYPNNMGCRYSIDVGHNNSALLKFKHFDLMVPDSTGNCTDWLMISCNETTKANPNHGKKYCGNRQWASSMRFVGCPSLLLEFVSDSFLSGSGFIVEYTVVENSNSTDDNSEVDCGTTLFNDSLGFILLPRNTKNYQSKVNCTYTISANQTSYTIAIDTYFYPQVPFLASLQDCNTESLTIGCVLEGTTGLNPNTTRVFCGTSTSHISDSEIAFPDCRTLKVSLRSSTYDYRRSYRMDFEVIRENELCGKTSFSDPNGVIYFHEPRWHFWKSVNCLYTIDGGHVNTVVLVMVELGSEDSESRVASCNKGWLTISCLVNGKSVPHPLADRKLCEVPDSPEIEFAACRIVLLNYSSDYIANDMVDFHIEYSMGNNDPECGNTSFTDSTGVITSPKFPLQYAHNLNCLYYIIGGRTTTISLSFLSFDLQGTFNKHTIDRCDSGFLKAYCVDEFTDTDYPDGVVYCGEETTPHELSISHCYVMVLKFESHSSVSGGGFEVHYTVIDAESPHDSPAYPNSTLIPVTLIATCGVGCKKSEDGSTCECSTTLSGDLVADTQINSSGQRGNAVGVSLTVVLVVIGAICVGAFLIFRRHRKKNRPEMLIQASDLERHQLDLEDNTAASGDRNRDRDTSINLPLIPMSIRDPEESSTSTSSLKINSEIQPGL